MSRELILRNPTWALRPNHVRDLLQQIIDYGSQWWGMPSISVPSPLPKGDKAGLTEKRLLQQMRTFQILDNLGPHGHAVGRPALPAPPETHDTQERRLVAAMIRCALKDFCQYYLSPYPAEQRISLNAFWWINGLPLTIPLDVFYEGPEALKRTARAQESFRLTPKDDPFDRLHLLTPDLVTNLGVEKGLPYLPWDMADLNDRFDSVSFESCCAAIDLDPLQLRFRMFLLPPGWADAAKDDSSDA